MSNRYIDLSHAHQLREPCAFFMVNALLKARMALQLESNYPHFDEDVNVYLADLMTSLSEPSRLLKRSPLIRAYDHEIAALANGSSLPRFRAEVYQANADALLIRFAIFDEGAGTTCPGRFFDFTLRQQLGRARMYYAFAADILSALNRSSSGIPEILQKLSGALEKYARILRHACREYLHLQPRIHEGDFFHLMRHVDAIGRRGEIAQKRDEFLDLYSSYLKEEEPNTQLKEELNQVITDLASLDPEFEGNPVL
jgi:hypothetical protein